MNCYNALQIASFHFPEDLQAFGLVEVRRGTQLDEPRQALLQVHAQTDRENKGSKGTRPQPPILAVNDHHSSPQQTFKN